MAGLVEVDVTETLHALEAETAGGAHVSFFAWMVKTIGDCIAANRHVHAVTGRRRRLVLFDEVDISVIVEKIVQRSRVPLPLVIRSVNEKSAEQIQQEIREAQKQRVNDESDYVLAGNGQSRSAMRLFYRLPQWARLFLMRRVLGHPFRKKRMMGTVMVTSTGSVVKKPWVVEERIEIRDILHLTVLFDHDLVDGAPETGGEGCQRHD